MIADAATPYEQACAILRHLQRYYRYTLSPVTPPENQDFVTYFLYVGKEGYCTYFASAMTVLCRMAGLPARYVEGFLAQPDSSGFAYVTGQNAHAWTEVYFEGFGWVPFDPTPAQQNVDQQPPQNDPEPEPTPTPSPEPPQDEPDQPTPSPENPEQSNEPDDTDTPDDEPDQKDPPSPWLWLLLLLLAAVAAVCVRIFLRMPDRMAKKQQNVSDQIFLYGSAAYTLMKLTGRTPRKGETPLRFARRMDKQRALCRAGHAPVAHDGPEQLQPSGTHGKTGRSGAGYLQRPVQASRPVGEAALYAGRWIREKLLPQSGYGAGASGAGKPLRQVQGQSETGCTGP